jgi:hypothetical protein
MVPIKLFDKKLTSDIINFFISYNEAQGKKFKPSGFGSRLAHFGFGGRGTQTGA